MSKLDKALYIPQDIIIKERKNIFLRNLIVIWIGYYHKAFGHNVKRERSDEYIMHYCIDGCGWVKTNNATWKVNKGDAFFLNKNTPHCYGADTENPNIDNNYQNSDLSLKLLSEVFSIDYSTLSKIFKKQFGINFRDYLVELRITKAKELLLHSQKNIASIANDVGYINYLSFKRAFIRIQEISPKEFREQQMLIE